jgi:hypothetical protein
VSAGGKHERDGTRAANFRHPDFQKGSRVADPRHSGLCVLFHQRQFRCRGGVGTDRGAGRS